MNFWNRGILKGAGFSEINGKLICEAKMVVSFPEIVNKYLPKILILDLQIKLMFMVLC